MVMSALMRGGMGAFYSRAREKELRALRPAERNPTGYFEPHPEELKDIDFPLNAEGMVVKLLSPWETLPKVPVHEYRVLILTRDPREVAVSMAKMNNGCLTTADWKILSNYDKYVGKGIALAHNRKDFDTVCVANYEDILTDPLSFFTTLKLDYKWPIKPTLAASAVDTNRKTVMFDGPPSGDLAKDIQTQTMSLGDAIRAGRFACPDDVRQAALEGAEVSMRIE